MKNTKKSIAFPLLSMNPERVIALMKVTECTDFVIELNNIEAESDFCVSTESADGYAIKQKKSTDRYVDIVFRSRLDDKFEETIGNIIKSNPEIISVHCMFHAETKEDMTLDFMLDEHVLVFCCRRDLYDEFQLKVRNCLFE